MVRSSRTDNSTLPETRRSLPMALLQAREATINNFRPMLAKLKVTDQQWRVLRVLGEVEALTATDVASRAALLGPSLTRIVRDLEKRKLLRRRRDTADARRQLLEITSSGSALLARGAPLSLDISKGLEQRIGKKQLNTLLELLQHVTAAAKAAAPEGDHDGPEQD